MLSIDKQSRHNEKYEQKTAVMSLKLHSGGIPTSRDTRVKHIVYWTETDQLSVAYGV